MKRATLKALRGSINKWRKIVGGTGEDRGTINCPLCRLLASIPLCSGCPVSEKAGTGGCHRTPFDKWSDHIVKHASTWRGIQPGCKTCKRLARAELNFLIGLLPKRKGGRQ